MNAGRWKTLCESIVEAPVGFACQKDVTSGGLALTKPMCLPFSLGLRFTCCDASGSTRLVGYHDVSPSSEAADI